MYIYGAKKAQNQDLRGTASVSKSVLNRKRCLRFWGTYHRKTKTEVGWQPCKLLIPLLLLFLLINIYREYPLSRVIF